MKYEDLVVTGIEDPEDYKKALKLLSDEFTEHEHTDLNFYDYVLLVKYKNQGVGMTTAMRHLPSKVCITEVIVDAEYRREGVALKLCHALAQKVKSDGYKYLIGFIETTNIPLLRINESVGCHNDTMVGQIMDLEECIPIIKQKEMVLKARQKTREKE